LDWKVLKNLKALQKLIEEKPDDPRNAQWCCVLGQRYLNFPSGDFFQKGHEYLLKAGKLGLGEGCLRLADDYATREQNWDQARRFYQKAVELHHPVAAHTLGTQALRGYFHISDGVTEHERRPPDYQLAFQLYQKSASLDCGPGCLGLGLLYAQGQGTEKNPAKALKWFRRGTELGNAHAMRSLGACYRHGFGVDRSDEQAKYWFEKSLELEDDETVRRYVAECNRNLTGH
jgi:TPR repeat protein